MNVMTLTFLLRYKGRVELPDNLKSLFRPMSMVIPDYELIAEIMLFSEGFKSAKLLSGKIINLYQLSSKRLSQQVKYKEYIFYFCICLFSSGMQLKLVT